MFPGNNENRTNTVMMARVLAALVVIAFVVVACVHTLFLIYEYTG